VNAGMTAETRIAATDEKKAAPAKTGTAFLPAILLIKLDARLTQKAFTRHLSHSAA